MKRRTTYQCKRYDRMLKKLLAAAGDFKAESKLYLERDKLIMELEEIKKKYVELRDAV